MEGACGMDCCRVLKVKTPSSGYKFLASHPHFRFRASARERERLSFQSMESERPRRERRVGVERETGGDIIQFSERREKL